MSEGRGFRRRGSLVWPVFLIGVGAIFLLSNIGLLDLNLWLLLTRLWPLLLVAVGLDMLLGRRSGFGSAIAIILMVALFAGGVWVVQTTGGILVGDIYPVEFSQPLEGAQRANININFSVGRLEVGALGEDANNLASGVLHLAEDEYLDQDFRVSSGAAYLSLDTKGQQFYPSWWFGPKDEERNWYVNLNREIALEIEIDTGVGQTILNLENLNLISLDMNTGVGQVIVNLPSHGEYSVRIDGGVGELSVYLPEDFPVRVQIDTGLGNTHVVGDFRQNGGLYISSGYEGAAERATIYVNGGVGEVNIIQSD